MGEEPAPGDGSILKSRHVLEAKDMDIELLWFVNAYMDENGLKLSQGTIVDSSIINSPSSKKNRDQAINLYMHQTSKGNWW